MRMYQEMHVLKHLFVAASREENYPVSLKISPLINTHRLSHTTLQQSSLINEEDFVGFSSKV